MKIPASPEALDREWLTAALRHGGAIRNALVASLGHEQIWADAAPARARELHVRKPRAHAE